MIVVLLCLYVLANLAVFIRLRRTDFYVFRWYALGAAGQAVISLLPWRRCFWVSHCWAYIEPFMVVWRALAVVEALYYATTRIYAAERRQLMLILGCAGAIVVIILAMAAWHVPPLDVEIAFITAASAGLATIALTACWYFWRRPVGIARIIRLHAYCLTALLTIKAAVSLTWPAIRESNQWYWAINGCYLTAISAVMLFRAWLGSGDPYPQRKALVEDSHGS